MTDKLIKFNNSLIHYGDFNQRVYIMKLKDDPIKIIKYTNNIAKENNLTRICAKIKGSDKKAFLEKGFQIEAKIPNFFNGKEDGFFLSHFLNDKRSQEDKKLIKDTLGIAEFKKNKPLKKIYNVRPLGTKDIPDMIELYNQVFKTYPFPIHSQKYIQEAMITNTFYFGIILDNKLKAIASCDLDKNYNHAEMTDFATLPEFRGNNSSRILLNFMNKFMKDKGVHTLYSTARSKSIGMNTTFARENYTYSGTLINHANISGNIESLNIWYKNL